LAPALERFQRDWNKKAVLENALVFCFGEHVHPAADRIVPDHALAFVLSSNFITGLTPLMVILL
jgi:hypothetical protein